MPESDSEPLASVATTSGDSAIVPTSYGAVMPRRFAALLIAAVFERVLCSISSDVPVERASEICAESASLSIIVETVFSRPGLGRIVVSAVTAQDLPLVLGLVTSKRPELEDPEAIKARIAEAAQYVPLERLCLSTQCGFASTEEGNKLTEEQQWAKIALVRSIAEEVWGE